MSYESDHWPRSVRLLSCTLLPSRRPHEETELLKGDRPFTHRADRDALNETG